MKRNLSEHGQVLTDLSDRLLRVYSALGLDPLERAIIVVLVNNPGTWGITALASYTGFNRTTVYRRLLLREKQGLLCRKGGQWDMTEFGREGATKILNEIGGLVFGDLDKLSDDVINLCAKVCKDTKPDEARVLTFKGSKL